MSHATAKTIYLNLQEGRTTFTIDYINETFTYDRGELYRAMQKEYGRCISKL